MTTAIPGSAKTAMIVGFDEWRTKARDMLAQGIPPSQALWTVEGGTADLIDAIREKPQHPLPPPAASAQPARVPRHMLDMLQTASCYRSPDRWAFLYQVLWRWHQGEQVVLSAADEDGRRLHAMVKAVRREEHDMHAYLRFRERPEAVAGPRFVAWYEPSHDVLPQVAKHFVGRMGAAPWMIATPDATAIWDGHQLHEAGPMLRGPQDIDDAGEALWLTYYRSIFNPSRLNPRLMHSHIPSRHWKHLPEGRLVPDMVAEAAAGARRVGQVHGVRQREGSIILMSEERAQPHRAVPTTLEQCRRCDLWERATQAIGGSGPTDARMMLVGEQPGDQEDITGAPFVGPAGQLLDHVLQRADLDRRTLYLTNAVKHFKWEPRGKRRLHKTPGQREVEACSHWLNQELGQVDPEVVVALGSTALKALLGTTHIRLGEVLGKPMRHANRWIIAVYHPAYVLRLTDESARKDALALMTDGLRQAKMLLEAAQENTGEQTQAT